MPSTKLDLILELWKSHGIFALGWIFCLPMAAYIVLLHKRNNTIYKEYIAAMATANAAVVPLVDKAVSVMTQVIQVVDTAADAAHHRDQLMKDLCHQMEGLKGQLDIVIRTFIGERYYTESAISAGAERSAVKGAATKPRLKRGRRASQVTASGNGNSEE